jgi:hypothetical protein
VRIGQPDLVDVQVGSRGDDDWLPFDCAPFGRSAQSQFARQLEEGGRLAARANEGNC